MNLGLVFANSSNVLLSACISRKSRHPPSVCKKTYFRLQCMLHYSTCVQECPQTAPHRKTLRYCAARQKFAVCGAVGVGRWCAVCAAPTRLTRIRLCCRFGNTDGICHIFCVSTSFKLNGPHAGTTRTSRGIQTTVLRAVTK